MFSQFCMQKIACVGVRVEALETRYLCMKASRFRSLIQSYRVDIGKKLCRKT